MATLKKLLALLTIFSVLLLPESSKAQIKTVKIGTQEWMAENLNVSTFRNGDPIPEAKTFQEFLTAGMNAKPAWCYYNNDSLNSRTYGKLYNWYAVNDPRGLAPIGWRISGSLDWSTLILYLGGDTIAGLKIKSTSGWKENGNGDNASGFSGLPAGYCDNKKGHIGLGETAVWWSRSSIIAGKAATVYLTNLNKRAPTVYANLTFGFSVRCLKE